MDYGTRYTERQKRILEIRLQRTYTEAQKDLLKKLDEFTKQFRAKEKVMNEKLMNGEITRKEYGRWLKGQVFTGAQWEQKVKDMTDSLNDYRADALEMIRDKQIDVFSTNANYQAYLEEHDMGKDFGFDLYDADAVENLLKNDPELLPRKVVDKKKNAAWNQGIINNCVTQGIIQGESIPKIAARIANKTANQNMNSATMYARTAMTSAQNAGRMEMLRESKDMGIEVRKKWMATHDSRTRDSHVTLDGQVEEVEKPFHSDFGKIMFPGDPSAHPGDVYNCRCALVYVYPKYKDLQDFSDDNEVKDEKYEEWQQRKKEVHEKNRKEVEDVTDDFLKQAKPGNGKYSAYDGFEESRGKDKKDKEKIGHYLVDNIGGNLRVLNDTTSERLADFYWDKRYWELKSPTKATNAKKAVNSGKGQIKKKPGGIILNYADMDIDVDLIVKDASSVMGFLPYESKLIIFNKGKIVKVIQYSNKK